jgi:O-antigen/teichoic acid export membrane protein
VTQVPPSDTTAPVAGADRAMTSRTLARRGSASLVGAGVSALAGLLVTVIVTRSVGKEHAGVFFAATSAFLLFATASRLGTPTGYVYFLARQRALGQRSRMRATLWVGLLPVIAVAAASATALFLAIPVLAHSPLLTKPGKHTDGSELIAMVRALVVFVPMAAVYDGITAATRGLGSMRPTVLIERFARPLGQVIGVLAAGLAGSAVWLAWGWAIPYAPALAVSIVLLLRLARKEGVGKPDVGPEEGLVVGEGLVAREVLDRRGLWREFWGFTGPRSIANLAQMALQRFDIPLVYAMTGAVPAAIYAAATRFLVVGQIGQQSISLAVQPTLSELLAKRDVAGANLIYRTATTWLVLVTWPLYLASAIAAPQLLRLFGKGYGSGANVMIVLSAAMLVATACGMVDMVLTMGGRTTWNLGNVLVALAVNVGLDLFLIPKWGIIGAATGWAAAILANNLVPLAQIGLVLKMHPFGRSTTVAVGLASVAYGAIPLVVVSVAGRTLAAVVVGLAAGTIAYLAGLWRFRAVLQLDQMPIPGLRRLRRRGLPT